MPDATLFVIGFLVMIVSVAAVWSVGLLGDEQTAVDPDRKGASKS
jgi:hypothetical protein